jgi:hypothetical protein
LHIKDFSGKRLSERVDFVAFLSISNSEMHFWDLALFEYTMEHSICEDAFDSVSFDFLDEIFF